VIYKLGFSDIDITQVTISKSKKTSTGTMMLARNPVTIISATKT
jgi:cobalt-precorrin-6B (C15)-methyltransferase